MDREDKMRKELLKCAIEAKSDETEPLKSSEQDREWLKETYQKIVKDSNALIDGLKNCLAVLKDNYIEEDLGSETLEILSEYCEDIDLAKDMEKLGGYPIVIQHLSHRHPVIRANAADVLAVSVQNNEYCQDKLLGMKVLPRLLKMTEVSDCENEHQVSIKAVYAVSCLVREHDSGLETFIALDGFSFLMKALFSGVPKLQFKALYLMSRLCVDNKICTRAVYRLGVLSKLANLLHETNNADIVIYLLDLLHSLAKLDRKQFKNDCSSNSINLQEIMATLSKKKTFQDELENITERWNILKKVLRKK